MEQEPVVQAGEEPAAAAAVVEAETADVAAVEMEASSSEEPPAPPPDPLLEELYGSDRPAVELLPSVPLSPIVTACLLPKSPKVSIGA